MLLLAVGIVVVVVGLSMVIDSAVYYNKIHRGVSVAGQNLAGLTQDEAAAALTQQVKEAEQKPITLVSGASTWTVLPTDIGASIDVTGTVQQAMDITRRSNFIADLARRLKLYFSHQDVPLIGTVDETMLETFVAEVAEDIDLPPVDAGLAISGGQVTMVKGQSGRVVDQEALKTQLTQLVFTLHDTELPVPMMVKQADVQVDEDAIDWRQAETMLGGPVELTYKDRGWNFTPEQIALYLEYESEVVNGVTRLVPYVSAEKMSPFFDSIEDEVGTKPVDATFDSDGTQAWVVPGKDGETLDREKTAEALTEATLKGARRTAKLVLRKQEPDRTTAEAEAMGITDKIGGFSTYWDGGTWERRQNVILATEYVSDVIVRPDDVYDFAKEIGPRTEERGFYAAKGITGPGILEDVLGGGICQVSTTLFNAAFFTGLPIVERHNHSLYIDHYPTGRDATVTVGANMRFKNDTGHYILIRGVSDGLKTTFNIYGTDDGREVTYETSDFYDVVPTVVVSVTNTSLAWMQMKVLVEGQPGRRIMVERTVKWPDGREAKDKFYSYWEMVPRTIEWGYGPA